MKAFDINDLKQYASTLNDSPDEWYKSEQDWASDFLKGFEAWLAVKDLPKIVLPVRAVSNLLLDANDQEVAVCTSAAHAAALVIVFNKDYVPTEEQRTDAAARALADSISASGKRVRREVRDNAEEEEDGWDDEEEDEKPAKPKTTKRTDPKLICAKRDIAAERLVPGVVKLPTRAEARYVYDAYNRPVRFCGSAADAKDLSVQMNSKRKVRK